MHRAALCGFSSCRTFSLDFCHEPHEPFAHHRRGVCLLVGHPSPRVAAVCRTTDGFALAEEDLRLRGAGELLGLKQSGAWDLKALDPVADLELLIRAREAVKATR